MRTGWSTLRALAILGVTGCATLFSHGPDTVSFSSNPPGAQVLYDGVPIGVTPMTKQFDRQTFASHYITLRSPGFEPVRFLLEKTFNAVSILNLSSTCFWLTDFAGGAVIEYSPAAYHFELRPAGAPPPPMMPRPMSSLEWQPADLEALWFVLVNNQRLRTDVSRRGGEHLLALATLWRIDYDVVKASVSRDHEKLLASRYAYDLYVALRTTLNVASS